MPIAEEITGLSRKEITLALLKSGVKGGGLEAAIGFLTQSAKTPPRDRWLERLKTLAIWGPVALFGMGLAVFFLLLVMKIMVHMVGGLT